MVSVRLVSFGLAAIMGAGLSAQQSPVAATFVNETRPENGITQQPKPAAPALSLEMRGDILMARKMYREAIDVYLEGSKTNAILLNKIGIAYHQMLQLDLAKKHYEKALKINPKYAEAINNLGTVHYAQKSYRRAVSQYNKALRITPNSASIYSNLGTAQFARKKYKEASEAYEHALRLDPEVFEHRSSQGVLLQERTVEERSKFHYYLAKTYAKAGHNERALLYIRKSIEEGFKDKDKFREEPEFAKLQELQEFKDILALEPRVL
jgi:tetratricopeptide (TPR) repeat protein